MNNFVFMIMLIIHIFSIVNYQIRFKERPKNWNELSVPNEHSEKFSYNFDIDISRFNIVFTVMRKLIIFRILNRWNPWISVFNCIGLYIRTIYTVLNRKKRWIICYFNVSLYIRNATLFESQRNMTGNIYVPLHALVITVLMKC